jgi:hypothetical protein
MGYFVLNFEYQQIGCTITPTLRSYFFSKNSSIFAAIFRVYFYVLSKATLPLARIVCTFLKLADSSNFSRSAIFIKTFPPTLMPRKNAAYFMNSSHYPLLGYIFSCLKHGILANVGENGVLNSLAEAFDTANWKAAS